MIIPPDPEKDPRLFEDDPSASTPSLVPLPSPSSETVTSSPFEDDTALATLPLPTSPPRVHPHARSTGFDDLGVGYRGEALPPYAVRAERRQPPIMIPPLLPPSSPPTAVSSSDEILTPTLADPSSSRVRLAPQNSTAKLWESTAFASSSSSSSASSASLSSSSLPKRFLCIPISRGVRRWWRRWRRWVYALLVLLVVGIGLMIGLLVGLNVGKHPPSDSAKPTQVRSPWEDKGDGKMNAKWSSDASMGLTWSDSDLPPGITVTNCNDFVPLNQSTSAFTQLITPFPASNLSLATFTFPFSTSLGPANVTAADNSFDTDPDSDSSSSISMPVLSGPFAIVTRGLASAGMVQFVGGDASDDVTDSGAQEGEIRVDVVVRYAGSSALDSMMRVCEVSRKDGSSYGVGIYSPNETDGKISNPYLLDPEYLPSIQIVVRLPPSVLRSTTPALSIPSLTVDLDRASVWYGDLHGVEFGNWNVSSGRGSVSAKYIQARDVNVRLAQGFVSGRWNVSDSMSMNSTEGGISAEVIVSDAIGLSDNSTFNATTALVSRSTLKYPTIPTVPNWSPNHTVSLSLTTSSGPIALSILHQPPRTALSSLIATGEGDVSVTLNENYVGPFLVKCMWGGVSLLQPTTAGGLVDPKGWGRERKVVVGAVDTSQGGVFAMAGSGNATDLSTSASIISGGAYWGDWGDGNNQTQTALQVQQGDEGRGSQVGVYAAWGNVRLGFDATGQQL